MRIESVRQVIKEEINKLNHVLQLLGGTGRKRTVTKQAKAPTRKVSAAGRKRIAAAQRGQVEKNQGGEEIGKPGQ
jgi:hypothetical protein